MVNTFILADTPEETARLLDAKRLGKQRVETKQIIETLQGQTRSYANHPVVQMWAGWVPALKHYFNCMVTEWVHRGYTNTLPLYNTVDTTMPWWFQCKQLQLSHWCALLLKDRPHYEKTFGMTPERWKQIQPYLAWGYLYPHRLTPTQMSVLQQGAFLPPAEVCAPLGQGIPPQYRLDRSLVEAWVINPLRNPKTGRPLQPTGTIYRDYEKAARAFGLQP